MIRGLHESCKKDDLALKRQLISRCSPFHQLPDHHSFFFGFSSRMLRDSTPCFVTPSVGRLVGLIFTFISLGYLASLLLPNPLVTSNTAPVHPYATGVLLYPAFFFLEGGGEESLRGNGHELACSLLLEPWAGTTMRGALGTLGCRAPTKCSSCNA